MVLSKIILLSIFALFTQLVCLASVQSNFSSSICNQEGDVFMSEKGVESSLILDLLPNSTLHTCRRQFQAPDSYSFYVRLQKITSQSSTFSTRTSHRGNNRTCRLSISQSLNGEILPPWRVDPCELNDNQLEEEPCRLLQGSLNIAWNHHGNIPEYRLVITVIGNGNPHCLEKNRFACLEYDSVPLLCIDKDLTCDGIRHCPINVNGVSDEDPIMCAEQQRSDSEESTIQNMFKKIQIIKSFFTHEMTTTSSPIVKTRVIDIDKQLDIYEKDVNYSVGKRGHRGSLTGLSKYGPWGYLFLGMLLCGGALLVCGLWECCCRSNKPDPVDTLNGDVPTVFLESGSNEANTSSSSPRYEEIDPPPAYSVLFPNQKPFDSDPQSSVDNDERIHSTQTQTD